MFIHISVKLVSFVVMHVKEMYPNRVCPRENDYDHSAKTEERIRKEVR